MKQVRWMLIIFLSFPMLLSGCPSERRSIHAIDGATPLSGALARPH